MKFLLDHDVPQEVAHLLKHWGHAVTLLKEVLHISTSDDEVFAYGCEHHLVIITCNRNHFLSLAGESLNHPGVIILIRRRSRQIECVHIHTLLAKAGEIGIIGNVNFA